MVNRSDAGWPCIAEKIDLLIEHELQWCSGCFFNDFSITVHKERAADSRFASVSAPEPHRFFSRTEKSRAAAYASADFHYRLR